MDTTPWMQIALLRIKGGQGRIRPMLSGMEGPGWSPESEKNFRVRCTNHKTPQYLTTPGHKIKLSEFILFQAKNRISWARGGEKKKEEKEKKRIGFSAVDLTLQGSTRWERRTARMGKRESALLGKRRGQISCGRKKRGFSRNERGGTLGRLTR